MSDNFAKPVSGLGVPGLGSLGVAAYPTAGQGLALGVTGRIPPAAAKFTSYTPVWSSAGTAVSLGNGTVLGKYVQIGKFVFGQIRFAAGSTSTFGTGVYSLSLPVAGNTSNFTVVGTGYLYDSSADSLWTVTTVTVTSTTCKFFITGTAGAYAVGGAGAPFGWAASDEINVNFAYEAA